MVSFLFVFKFIDKIFYDNVLVLALSHFLFRNTWIWTAHNDIKDGSNDLQIRSCFRDIIVTMKQFLGVRKPSVNSSIASA